MTCYDQEVSNSTKTGFSANLDGAEEHSQHGLHLLAMGQNKEASQAFQQAITIDPRHVEAHHGLIRALREDGQFKAAVNAAIALTELTPLDPLAFASLSIAEQKAGRIAEAEAAAARARILEWKQQLAAVPQMQSEPEFTTSRTHEDS